MKNECDEIGRRHGIKVEYFDAVDSTNDTAREGGYSHMDIIVAREQTAGRGQRGNSWRSEPGRNLTFTIVVEPASLLAADQFLLSDAVSLSVADALMRYGIEATIKWPNDIYVGDRKIAGILLEHDIRGDKVSRSLAGIGLNVNQTGFTADLANPTSMALETGEEYDLAEVLERVAELFRYRYCQLSEGFSDILEEDYHERLYLLGQKHRFVLPGGEEFEGAIRRVESSGVLRIEDSEGTIRDFLFKEVDFAIGRPAK